MKRHLLGALTIFAFLFVMGALTVYAQDMIKVEVPFAFTAGTATFPAGSYEIKPEHFKTGPDRLLFKRLPNGETKVVQSGTRLSQKDSKEPLLIFDKVGDKDSLSEVYIPGEDGFFLTGVPGKHTHVTVKGMR